MHVCGKESINTLLSLQIRFARLLIITRYDCYYTETRNLYRAVSPSNAAVKRFIQFLRCADDTRAHAHAEREREREATRILRVSWPMLRLDNRSGGEVTRPRRGRRYRRESARSAPRNQLERSLKLQVINDASKPVTNPHGSSRQRDTLIISPPS